LVRTTTQQTQMQKWHIAYFSLNSVDNAIQELHRKRVGKQLIT